MNELSELNVNFASKYFPNSDGTNQRDVHPYTRKHLFFHTRIEYTLILRDSYGLAKSADEKLHIRSAIFVRIKNDITAR